MNWWYKFKCWAFHRYSTVKPRGLGHGWVDRDVLMLHVIFEVLSKYVEEEYLPSLKHQGLPEDFSAFEGRIDTEKEIIELYLWWTEEYDCDLPYKPMDDHEGTHEEYMTLAGECFEEEVKLNAFVLKQMKRAIDLSPCMWT